MPDTTLLTFSAIDIPPYSIRGASQSVAPLDQSAGLVRTWNGVLVDLSLPRFQKYRTTISCEDQQPPALDGQWQGKIIIIGWIAELCYKTGLAGAPFRTPVAGSSRVEGDFTFYRPSMSMMITSFDIDTDEYGAAVGWSMEAEEV